MSTSPRTEAKAVAKSAPKGVTKGAKARRAATRGQVTVPENQIDAAARRIVGDRHDSTVKLGSVLPSEGPALGTGISRGQASQGGLKGRL